MRKLTTDLCIIGTVQMGARIILIEKNKMDGDCLNSGCVPSKALLAFAKKHLN